MDTTASALSIECFDCDWTGAWNGRPLHGKRCPRCGSRMLTLTARTEEATSCATS